MFTWVYSRNRQIYFRRPDGTMRRNSDPRGITNGNHVARLGLSIKTGQSSVFTINRSVSYLQLSIRLLKDKGVEGDSYSFLGCIESQVLPSKTFFIGGKHLYEVTRWIVMLLLPSMKNRPISKPKMMFSRDLSIMIPESQDKWSNFLYKFEKQMRFFRYAHLHNFMIGILTSYLCILCM